jgi:thiol:disulfide interchange protein
MSKMTVTIIAVLVIVVGGCSRPEPEPAAGPVMVTNHESVSVEWGEDLPAALERARSEGKPVLVNFYADWCVWCKRLEATTLRDSQVANLLSDRVVPVSLDVDGNGKELSNQYRVDGLPTILVLDTDGREIGRIPGYMPPSGFLETVEGFLHQG